jgi:putative tryptophan/tyrosine transport system substrate-binding protein
MRRRDFITLVGGAATAWPFAARAQARWRIGMLEPNALSPSDTFVDAFREGLRELGYKEGRDVLLEIRGAGGSNEPLPALARELVALKVDVLLTLSTPAAIAAKQATATIPIVFTAVGDPVGAGVVPSLARPGGNATGFSMLATELSAKRLEILREIAPNTSPVAMLWNDTNPGMVLRARESERAATALGLNIRSFGIHDLVTFNPAFDAIANGGSAAVLILVDPFTSLHRQRIIDFVAERHLPAIYESREFVDAGGLISYGIDVNAMQRRAAVYVDKILKGTKPSDLPVEQPAKFQLVINLKTAKTLGLTIPPSLLARADEVIE